MRTPHSLVAILFLTASSAFAQSPPAAVASAPDAPPAPDLALPPALPTRLSVGKGGGFFQPSANLQFWALYDRANGQTATTLRIRRAELKIKGEIIPDWIAYGVMIDPAKLLKINPQIYPVDNQNPAPAPGTAGETVTVPTLQGGDTSVLQDSYITLLTHYADVSVGQFKIPVSWEGSNSSSKLVMPERAFVSRTFGDKRDVGIKAEKKLGKVFYYSLGVFDGQGLNRLDQNNQKDAALRLEVYPLDGIMVGAVGYTSIGQRNIAGTKDRLEGDVRVSLANVLLQGEYIWGRDKPADNAAFVEAQGAYGVLGYTLFDKLQPVVRVSFFDPDTFTAHTSVTAYEGGVNYYFQGNQMKLQASFSVFLPQSGASSSEGILAAQVSF